MLRIVHGDATQPQSPGASWILVHVCNDRGGWGKGFVLAISKRWKEPERQYRAWARGGGPGMPPFELGRVQFVRVELGGIVANLVGQAGYKRVGGVPPVRYDAIREGLLAVAAEASERGASVHMPRIGCGLAGGTWDDIGPIVDETLVQRGIPVTVYDWP